MFPLCDRNFHLARIGLVRAGCPQELSTLVGNRIPVSIVVVKNTAKLGRIQATGYTPPAVVVAGAWTREQLLQGGVPRAWAYVEEGAMEHRPEDLLASADLMHGLDEAVQRSCGVNANTPVSGQAWPVIQSVYPFRSHCVYEFKGRRYKQPYAINATKQVVLNGGTAAEIAGKFIHASMDMVPLGVHTPQAREAMQRVQTGVRYADSSPRANLQTFTTGGATSELVTQVVRNLSNIQESVMAYLDYMRSQGNRRPMKPSFSPVQLTDDGKIASALAAAGVNAFDFAMWALGLPVGKAGKRLPVQSSKSGASIGRAAATV